LQIELLVIPTKGYCNYIPCSDTGYQGTSSPVK
jgi:hypothetical protein